MVVVTHHVSFPKWRTTFTLVLKNLSLALEEMEVLIIIPIILFHEQILFAWRQMAFPKPAQNDNQTYIFGDPVHYSVRVLSEKLINDWGFPFIEDSCGKRKFQITAIVVKAMAQ